MDIGSGRSLVCRLPATLCALPIEAVVETLRPLPVERVAGAPDFVLGLSVIRGEPTAVVDLSLLLSGHGGTPRRFVVVRAGERRVAIAVDDVDGIRRLDRDRLATLPPLLREAAADRIALVGSLDADLLVTLDGARLVTESALPEIAAS
ncbi:MAG TPA: chemotaxis protein CheW [Bauldia sp.]|nr:chemotaxis protein CheW [Bauldia sp.]